MKACYARQMRDIDASASADGGIPSIVLMENAALACVDALYEDFGDLKHKSAAIFCGKGNNGGDGFAIAKHLYNRGVKVCVYLVCGNDIAGDAKINFDIINRMNVDMENITDTSGLEYVVKSYDIVIDAIFGTGMRGSARGTAAEVIDIINDNAKYILSVDVPSGMNSDTGEVGDSCVRADRTVTFAAYKIGMFKYPAADFTGKISVAGISIPDYIIEKQGISVNVIDDEFVRRNFPKRRDNSQKGDYGKVLVIAGSVGMTGAAYLASQTAMTMGSGLVTLGVCRSLNSILEEKTTEVMTMPLDDADGHLISSAADDIIRAADKADAVLIGPGLGRSDDIAEILAAVLKASRVPVIIDADGINAAARDMDIFKDCVCPIVFTPHAVEMSRLSGFDKDYIEKNRFEVSADFCETYGAALLLKGHHTIVTAPNGEQYINNIGNSGLATGGSGDVLAGILVSLAARGVDETTAAAMAAHIHGAAGDAARDIYGIESVTAARVMECIPEALKRILRTDADGRLEAVPYITG
ncbi:MAG: NAD(P)H-hydrate dehydratase [Firmicutes bacterium]|nr:NAD(P)H-hydrate dehydratase [Bacillota bacterium]